MMNSNKEPVTAVSLMETGAENGKNQKKEAEANGTLSKRFGVMDLWKIRSNARSFRIHNRLPRV